MNTAGDGVHGNRSWSGAFGVCVDDCNTQMILPDVSAWRVLSGLLKMHAFPMVIFMCGTRCFFNVACRVRNGPRLSLHVVEM